MTNNLSDFHKKIHANYIFHVLQRKSNARVYCTLYKLQRKIFKENCRWIRKNMCVFYTRNKKYEGKGRTDILREKERIEI